MADFYTQGTDAASETPYISLYDLCNEIRNAVSASQIRRWVCAEVAQISSSHGHYFLELIQKSDYSDAPVAKLRCSLWRDTASVVMPAFSEATGSSIEQGMRILVFLSVEFHEVYGLSGYIYAIDPSFTMGELEARRQAIMKRLVDDGVVDMNKELPLPTVVQRIAVVSASSAAGYGDFCNQISNNAYGIAFQWELFPALMQGAQAEASIISALDAVAARCDEFDAVVVIRGGGSRSDLACFDSYDIALNVAQFPIPVIVGIGHERDRSIVDAVAHTSLKTPTAVAEFIIAHDTDFLSDLEMLKHRLQLASANVIARANNSMAQYRSRLFASANYLLSLRKSLAEAQGIRVMGAANSALRVANSRLESLRTHVNSATLSSLRLRLAELERLRVFVAASDPRIVVSKGFSMLTDSNGKRVISVAQLKQGDVVVAHLADGSAEADVVSVKPSQQIK